MLLFFRIIVFKTIQNINRSAAGLRVWFLLLLREMLVVPMIYFLINTNRKKKIRE
jgi:hypothetical protein